MKSRERGGVSEEHLPFTALSTPSPPPAPLYKAILQSLEIPHCLIRHLCTSSTPKTDFSSACFYCTNTPGSGTCSEPKYTHTHCTQLHQRERQIHNKHWENTQQVAWQGLIYGLRYQWKYLDFMHLLILVHVNFNAFSTSKFLLLAYLLSISEWNYVYVIFL